MINIFQVLKGKVVAERVLGFCREDASFVEDAAKVCSVFIDHFQTMFAPYPLSNGVLVAWDACCIVIPYKICHVQIRAELDTKLASCTPYANEEW